MLVFIILLYIFVSILFIHSFKVLVMKNLTHTQPQPKQQPQIVEWGSYA